MLPTRRGVLSGLAGLAVTPCQVEQQTFDPRRFGAIGSRTGDDTAAFRAMYRAMRAAQAEDDAARLRDPGRPGCGFVVRLAPGIYRYTWNRWTWGLRRVSVLGEGAVIQCLHPGPYDLDQAPLLSNRDHYWAWEPLGLAYGGPSSAPVEQYGARIRTARPGDEAVALLSPAEAAPFRSGAWVMVQSYAQQQDGYPPNMRYFERACVTEVAGVVVRLDRPIRQLHRDDWPEDPAHPAAIGRARLVPIDRPDCPLALEQRFAGLTVRSNPNHAVRDPDTRTTREVLGIAGTLSAAVQDCTLIALGVSQAGDVTVTGSSFDYTEPDKLVDSLTLRGCQIGAVRECTGVNRLVLQGCTVAATAHMLARDVTVKDCTFTRSVALGRVIPAISLNGPTPTRRMSISSCRFQGADDGVHPPVQGETWVRTQVDGKAMRLLGDGRLSVAPGPELASLVAVLSVGWPVQAAGTGSPRNGRCTDIAGQGAGAVFAFTPDLRLQPGDTLAIPRLLSLTVRDCAVPHAFTESPDVPELSWPGLRSSPG